MRCGRMRGSPGARGGASPASRCRAILVLGSASAPRRRSSPRSTACSSSRCPTRIPIASSPSDGSPSRSRSSVRPSRSSSRFYVEAWDTTPAPFQSVTAMVALVSGIRNCEIAEGQPEGLRCELVEHNFLRVLGVRVALGRDFAPEDDVRGAPPVALISHALWVRRFGADPGVVDRTLSLERGHRSCGSASSASCRPASRCRSRPPTSCSRLNCVPSIRSPRSRRRSRCLDGSCRT